MSMFVVRDLMANQHGLQDRFEPNNHLSVASEKYATLVPKSQLEVVAASRYISHMRLALQMTICCKTNQHLVT